MKRKGMVADPLAARAPTISRDFDGDTFDPERDGSRLTVQLVAVRNFMADHQWHTLEEISHKLDAPEASVSARLRDLRKYRFGGYPIEREYVSDGLWRYRMTEVKPWSIAAVPSPEEWSCTERLDPKDPLRGVCGQRVKRDHPGMELALGAYALIHCPARTCPSRGANGQPIRKAIFRPITHRKDDEK